MKILNFFFLATILIACHNTPLQAQGKDQTLIGEIQDGKPVLKVDELKMLATFNANLLKLSGIEANFSELSIKITSDKRYLLIFKGATYRSSFNVTEVGSKLYAINKIACSTSDCSSEEFGCVPRLTNVSCYPCSNKGKCTKTVSNFSMLED